MKTPSQDLFNLIQSMTKSEKRYFSQFAEKHVIGDQNNYYKLFKVIDNQLVYDENIVKNSLQKEGIDQHFTALKFQLTERILEALHGFYQNNSIAENIKRELHICQLLMNKNLVEMAEKRLQKIENTIEQYNFLEFLPELFGIKHQIIAKQFYKNTDFEALEKIYETMKTATEKLQNMNVYERLNAFIQKNHYQKIRSNTLDFEALNDDEWLTNATLPLTFRSKMLRLSALATLNFMQGKTEEAYEHNQAFIALLEESDTMMDLYANRYVNALSNSLIDSLVLGKQDDLQYGIKKLRKVTANKIFQKQIPNLNLRIFRQTYLLEMNWAIANKDFQKGILLLPTIENGLKIHRKTIGLHNEITFYYLFAYCFFGVKRFSEALSYLNNILIIKAKVVTEIFEFAHLLNILTHFELENYDLLESLIPSTRRSLRSKRTLYETEDFVLSHIKKIINTIEKTKQQVLWEAFYLKIVDLKQKEQEQRVFNYFDFEWWAKRWK